MGAASITYAFYVGLSGLYLVTGLLSVLIPAVITWFWFRKRSVVQDGEEMPCMGLGDVKAMAASAPVLGECALFPVIMACMTGGVILFLWKRFTGRETGLPFLVVYPARRKAPP